MKIAVENAKKLVREDEELHVDENIIDIPTMFDGSWNSRGWTASRVIVSAIAESTSQVLDVAYKRRICSQCVEMEERKKNRACSTLEYTVRNLVCFCKISVQKIFAWLLGIYACFL